jgi:hypothetical protein
MDLGAKKELPAIRTTKVPTEARTLLSKKNPEPAAIQSMTEPSSRLCTTKWARLQGIAMTTNSETILSKP